MTTKRITVYVYDARRPHLMLQWVDPTTGRKKSKTSGTAKRREAERIAAVLEESLNSKIPRRDGSLAWQDFVSLYDHEHLDSLAAGSQSRSLGVLEVFSREMAPQTLADITGSLLSAYASRLRSNRSEATIATHMRTIHAALRWAEQNEFIDAVPRMPKQARAKRIRAKGRPLTDVEFSEMLIATSSVVGQSAKTSWRRLLIGLWLSGLRLEESLELTWGRTGEHHGGLWIDTAGKYPLLGIAAESEKGNTDRLLPMTPDFGEWLLRVPEDQRTGHVFPLTWQRHRGYRRKDTVSKVISEIGRQSGVTVNSDGKFASAHDLRRSFGLRWASSTKITPAELQALMRHTDISTTLGYYALVNATAFAEKLWESESK